MKFYNKFVYPVISDFFAFHYIFWVVFTFFLIPDNMISFSDAMLYCSASFPHPWMFSCCAFVFVLAFGLLDRVVQYFFKRHIAQKHPGVNECSEQDPGGAEGS